MGHRVPGISQAPYLLRWMEEDNELSGKDK